MLISFVNFMMVNRRRRGVGLQEAGGIRRSASTKKKRARLGFLKAKRN